MNNVTFNRSLPTILGVDIGASKIAFRIQKNGYSKEFRLNLSKLEHFQEDRENLYRLLETIKKDFPSEKFYIGIASAPAVSDKGIITDWPNNPGWVGLSLFAVFSTLSGIAPEIVDDGYAATRAESENREKKNFINIVFGEGIGGGIFHRSKILAQQEAGMLGLGHTIIIPQGRNCVCGEKGCLQAYTGLRSLINNARNLRPQVHDLTDLKNLLLKEDPFIVELFDEFYDVLFRALYIWSKKYELSEIIFSGYFIKIIPFLVEEIEKRFSQHCEISSPAIIVSVYENAPLEGAILIAKDKIKEVYEGFGD